MSGEDTTAAADARAQTRPAAALVALRVLGILLTTAPAGMVLRRHWVQNLGPLPRWGTDGQGGLPWTDVPFAIRHFPGSVVALAVVALVTVVFLEQLLIIGGARFFADAGEPASIWRRVWVQGWQRFWRNVPVYLAVMVVWVAGAVLVGVVWKWRLSAATVGMKTAMHMYVQLPGLMLALLALWSVTAGALGTLWKFHRAVDDASSWWRSLKQSGAWLRRGGWQALAVYVLGAVVLSGLGLRNILSEVPRHGELGGHGSWLLILVAQSTLWCLWLREISRRLDDRAVEQHGESAVASATAET